MEKENLDFFNSPVIQKNTPIKRLGLSRKRKSCYSAGSSITKIQACSAKSPHSYVHPPSEKDSIEKTIDKEIHNPSRDNNEDTKVINYNVKLEMLRKRVSEKEEKLKAIKLDKNKITHLEELIELWKIGCKNAFLHLVQLLKEKHPEKVNNKMIMNNLGILNTMTENFENDSDIFLSDSSEQ